MDKNWNNGIDYSFPLIKKLMCIYGMWPLQQNRWFCTIRWLLVFAVETLGIITVLMEFSQHCGIPIEFLDKLLAIDGCIHACISSIFPRMYMRKMAINIRSLADDWTTPSMGEKERIIMTSYARVGRMVIIGQYLIGVACIVCIMVVGVGEKQQVIIVDNNTIILRNFPIPTTCLFNGISYRTYIIIVIVQGLQAIIIALAEVVSDSFFFCVTMHLSGQLDILKTRFIEIGQKMNNKDYYRNTFKSLIIRHYQLIMLAKNIEDSFNVNILIRLSCISVVIAASGMRVITSVRHQDYAEVARMMSYVQFYIVQCFLFTHASDTLRTQSESIISAIYNTTWYELPPTAIKDLVLVMIRLKIPLQISAGKFFYLSRTTITDILKTAMAYVSFLQVTTDD